VKRIFSGCTLKQYISTGITFDPHQLLLDSPFKVINHQKGFIASRYAFFLPFSEKGGLAHLTLRPGI
jgi:hypothetical protein